MLHSRVTCKRSALVHHIQRQGCGGRGELIRTLKFCMPVGADEEKKQCEFQLLKNPLGAWKIEKMLQSRPNGKRSALEHPIQRQGPSVCGELARALKFGVPVVFLMGRKSNASFSFLQLYLVQEKLKEYFIVVQITKEALLCAPYKDTTLVFEAS